MSDEICKLSWIGPMLAAALMVSSCVGDGDEGRAPRDGAGKEDVAASAAAAEEGDDDGPPGEKGSLDDAGEAESAADGSETKADGGATKAEASGEGHGSEAEADGSEAEAEPVFEGSAAPLPERVREHMAGRSWREGCPVGLEDLSLLVMSHWNMDGDVSTGKMVVATRVAPDVLGAFERLFELEFPIARMRRIDHYDGDDDRSMAANNSSAFNCRHVAGTKRWSEHSFGTAVDINPVQNPYVRGDYVAPPAGREYLDRSDARPGMLVDGPAVRAFTELGWGWGGHWRHSKDYQHFSESGR